MLESIVSLIVATFLLLGSPGPAPLALAATGATYGFKKAVPFLIGILCGLVVAIVGATAGIASFFSTFPDLKLGIQVVGLLYIVYVALKIARAPVLSSYENEIDSPPKLVDGFILNVLNPKVYAAFFALFSQFLLPIENTVMSYITTGILVFTVATVVDIIWLALGGVLRPVFESPMSTRVLRVTFAVLMVVAVVVVTFEFD